MFTLSRPTRRCERARYHRAGMMRAVGPSVRFTHCSCRRSSDRSGRRIPQRSVAAQNPQHRQIQGGLAGTWPYRTAPAPRDAGHGLPEIFPARRPPSNCHHSFSNRHRAMHRRPASRPARSTHGGWRIRHNRVASVMATMMRRPMVGVPAYRCVCGPSVRTCCPTW